jgi:hypothetical protein
VTTPDDSDMSGNPPSNPPVNPAAASDDPVINAMVQDAGGDGELGAALVHIRALRATPAPTPSPELAALLADGLPGGATPKGRMRPGHRALLGVILIGGLGTTAAGAAFADEGIRRGAATVFANVINLAPFGMSLPVIRPTDTPTDTPAAPHPIPGTPGPSGSSSETTDGGAGHVSGPNPESSPSSRIEGNGGASDSSSDPGGATPPSTGPDAPGASSDGGSGSSGADQEQPSEASSTN